MCFQNKIISLSILFLFFPQLVFTSQEECTSPNSRKLAVAESPSPATEWRKVKRARVSSPLPCVVEDDTNPVASSGNSVTNAVAYAKVCQLDSAIKKVHKKSSYEKRAEMETIAFSLSTFVDDHVDRLSPRAVAHAKKVLSFVDEVSKKNKK